MKSTVTFREYFYGRLYEDMTAASTLGGVSGFTPDNINSNDFYAPGDTRIPKGGATYTRNGKISRKKRKKLRKKKQK